MAKFDDFDLDIVVKKQDNIVQPNITSKSLCTPGCITGILPESVTEVYQKCWETQSCRDFDSISNVHLLGEEPRVQYFVD